MNRKMNAFLLATILLSVATLAHAEMDTIPTKSILSLTISKAQLDLKTLQIAMNDTISRDQINHFTVTQNHPESIPHNPTARASQDDVTILCYILGNDGARTVEGLLNLPTPVNSPLYKKQCKLTYPSCEPNCNWIFM